jgi:peptidoglycan-N-acetylglucosamine deacetylase
VGSVRLRMVVIGLVLGVMLAVAAASQGCGSDHVRRHRGGGGSGALPSTRLHAGPPLASALRRPVRVVRRPDPGGPFFGFRAGHMTRVDAPRHRREIALTFDDGPGPQTMALLHELRRLHVRATFFVVGSMAALRPGVVRALARAGMEIGNHTWSHAAMPALSGRMQRRELVRTNSIIARLAGRRPRFFRPPDGRVGARTARIVRRMGMVGVLRTIDTRDWTLPGVRVLIRRALSVRPGGVIQMHDAGGYTRSQTVAAVPHIVRGLRRRHLEPVTISRLYNGR